MLQICGRGVGAEFIPFLIAMLPFLRCQERDKSRPYTYKKLFFHVSLPLP